VITGEGYLDDQSFEGKVVGGVQAMADIAGKPVGAVVGDVAPEVATRIDHISLVEAYGNERAMNEPLWCIERAAATMLERLTELQ
jgi:glycerate 2-kinase